MEGVRKRRMGNAFSSRDTEVKSWFPAVAGVEEPAFAALSEEERSRRFFRADEDGNLRLMRGGAGKPHKLDVCCGRFQVVSVGELSERRVPSPQHKGSLTFVTRKDAALGSMQCVDVAHLQSLPENRGAMFQVASNMNAVEGISEATSVEEKTFVSDYIFDKTQGPAVSFLFASLSRPNQSRPRSAPGARPLRACTRPFRAPRRACGSGRRGTARSTLWRHWATFAQCTMGTWCSSRWRRRSTAR